MNPLRKNEILIRARSKRTRKIHCFHEGEVSLCGLVNIEHTDSIHMVDVSTRLHRYLWPKDDLNYCGRCRISLNSIGVI